MSPKIMTGYYKENKDSSCLYNLYLPDLSGLDSSSGEIPKILLIHGGGWTAMDRTAMDGIAGMFVQKGFIVCNIEYRLAPVYPWPACGDDCLMAAQRFIDNSLPGLENISAHKIFILGASSGGHLALMTGLRLPRNDVHGIISISGIADPWRDSELNPNRYKALLPDGIDPEAFPGAFINPDMPPILLTHQYHDTVVPIDSPLAFIRQARDAGIRSVDTYFYDMQRQGEGHAIWQPEFLEKKRILYPDIEQAVLRFINRILKKQQIPLPLPHEARYLGTLKTFSSKEIHSSPVSIGFEGLDRDLFHPEYCYDRLAEAGFKHARVQTGWCKCEKVKGMLDFSWLDCIVDNLLARGIQPWFNVGFGNKLYMPDAYGETAVGHVPLYYGEETLEAWKKFVRELALHYKGRITHFEIWNEPDIPAFWQPRQPDAAEYARLCDLTIREIKAVYPEAHCGGVVASWKDFVKIFAEHCDLKQLDFYSVHTYLLPPESGYGSSSWDEYIHTIQGYFAGNGGSHIQIWQGEAGLASWAPEHYWMVRRVRESQRNQAVWILRRILLDQSLNMPVTSIYQTVDMMEKSYQMGNSTQNRPALQGILNGLTYSPKMSFYALANAISIFRDGIHPVPEAEIAFHMASSYPVDRAVPPIYGKLFQKNKEKFLFYWSGSDPESAEDPVPGMRLQLKEGSPDSWKNPVLVNLLSGDIFSIHSEWNGSVLEFKNLPLTDYPLMICKQESVSILTA